MHFSILKNMLSPLSSKRRKRLPWIIYLSCRRVTSTHLLSLVLRRQPTPKTQAPLSVHRMFTLRSGRQVHPGEDNVDNRAVNPLYSMRGSPDAVRPRLQARSQYRLQDPAFHPRSVDAAQAASRGALPPWSDPSALVTVRLLLPPLDKG